VPGRAAHKDEGSGNHADSLRETRVRGCLGRRVYRRYGGGGAKGAQPVDQGKSGSGRRTGGYARGTSAVPEVSKG
jgi:hypothetical protein